MPKVMAAPATAPQATASAAPFDVFRSNKAESMLLVIQLRGVRVLKRVSLATAALVLTAERTPVDDRA